MGWCRWAGHGWHAGFTKEECDAVLGQYSETDPNAGSDDDTDSCFVTTIMTRSLAQTILDLGQTYRTQINFREDVLRSSARGTQMVALYYKYNPTLRSIAKRDPELLGESVHVWFSMQPFIEAVVALARGDESPAAEPSEEIRFANVTHQRIERLFDRLRAGSADRDFHAALDSAAYELSGYVGLTPAEALDRLRRKGA
jgi:hypothetical protein